MSAATAATSTTSSGMYTIPMSELSDTLEYGAIMLRHPVMVWGPPGVGKSQVIAQLAKKLGAVLVDIRLSQYDSVDLRGFPGVEAATQHTVWYPPSTLPFKGNPAFDGQGPPIILFLDEINAASASTAAVAYQIVNDRQCGEHVLLDNVVVIAAGNRETDKGVTNRMPLPLANRFTHVEVEISTDGWCAWATKSGVHDHIVAFLTWQKALLMGFDPSKPTKAFATPRSWEKAARVYAATMPEPIKRTLMAGDIGAGTAAMFWGFVDVLDKVIPLSEILADPTGCAVPEASALSMKYATTLSVSGAMTPKTAKALHTYISRFDPEFVVLAWTLAVRRDPALFAVPEFETFAQQYKAVFA